MLGGVTSPTWGPPPSCKQALGWEKIMKIATLNLRGTQKMKLGRFTS